MVKSNEAGQRNGRWLTGALERGKMAYGRSRNKRRPRGNGTRGPRTSSRSLSASTGLRSMAAPCSVAVDVIEVTSSVSRVLLLWTMMVLVATLPSYLLSAARMESALLHPIVLCYVTVTQISRASLFLNCFPSVCPCCMAVNMVR